MFRKNVRSWDAAVALLETASSDPVISRPFKPWLWLFTGKLRRGLTTINSLGTVLLISRGRMVDIQSDRKQFEEK